MVVWRIRVLSSQLKEAQFAAGQILPYLVAALVFVTLIFVFTDWSRPWDRDEFETAVDSLTTLMNGVISVVGLYACYRANGAASGVQLVERVCAIGVVLFVRFLVFTALAFTIWAYAMVYLNLWRPSWEELDLLSLLLVALYWVRLRSHVAYVAKDPQAGDVPAA